MSLTKDAQINKHALDYEWMRQPSLVREYAQRYGDALFERDIIKDKLELFASDLALKIRADKDAYGLDKITDKAVEATIIKSKKYQKYQKQLREVNKNVNAYFAAQKVMEHKKTALEFLSRHYFTGYWSDPKIPNEIRNEYEQEVTTNHIKTLARNKRIGGKHGKKEE